MLNTKHTFSSFSVDDIEKAQTFYQETLGPDVTLEGMGMLTLHLPDGAHTIIYPKGKQHKPASFTVLNFVVEDIEKTVDEFIELGISFEQYEGDISTDEKGISHNEGPLIAWFKDPAENILSIIEEQK